jgi:glutaconate CoA-transferase subunit B
VDRYGNLNSTVIGEYATPTVRLPGSGGATEIATSCQRIYIVMRHDSRAFVERLAFVTSLGHGVTGRERRKMGIGTAGPTLIVTDLCTMRPDEDTCEFQVVTMHPGVTRDQIRERTEWAVQFADRVGETPAPTSSELQALRDLYARTAAAHGAGTKVRQTGDRA